MSPLVDAAKWILLLSWIVSAGVLGWNHKRVRAERKRRGIAEERPSIRDARSMKGLAIEGLSFGLAVVFSSFSDPPREWQCMGSILFSVIAAGLFVWALRHLDLEWRIKAVVTEDHRLVTTGPYGFVRHPVFAALVSLLLASTLLTNPWWGTVVCLAVCLYGTEIRVRAEDGLLERRFGQEFTEYKARVAAYIPFLR
ncbi:MAG: isoprenylcysteine carboxylmethyltransferase family protein [Bryobacteraceae bacterium]